MKRIFSLALISLLAGGCASQYVVVLTNGHRVLAAKKPHLEQTAQNQINVVFVDANGQTNVIPSTQVRAVVSATDVKNRK